MRMSDDIVTISPGIQVVMLHIHINARYVRHTATYHHILDNA